METLGQGQAFFATFLQLESAARRADSREALRYTIVNDTRRLLPFRQAALVLGDEGDSFRVEAVSGVAVLDDDAPYLRWLTRVATRLGGSAQAGAVYPAAADLLPEPERTEWSEWCPPHAVWCPLKTRDGVLFGALWLVREEPWQQSEAVLLERLAEGYAHAWLALVGRRRRTRRSVRQRMALAVPLLLLITLALPVTQSALAPAEVVAVEPLVVSAPLDGVIARFYVRPNQPVNKGDRLLAFDDTNLRSQVAVSTRTLGVAQAELRQVSQGAMIDRREAGKVALIESQVRLRQVELDFARSLLDRVEVTAEQAGVAVFTDENDWIGRPVATGQRILQLADPGRTELRISLPVRDAIALNPGAPVELFLDVDPLAALPAKLISASYEAEMTPAGVLSYRVRAAFPPGFPPPRIGLQGVANIQGQRVPLALYLFRRPLATLRQTFGF